MAHVCMQELSSMASKKAAGGSRAPGQMSLSKLFWPSLENQLKSHSKLEVRLRVIIIGKWVNLKGCCSCY